MINIRLSHRVELVMIRTLMQMIYAICTKKTKISQENIWEICEFLQISL